MCLPSGATLTLPTAPICRPPFSLAQLSTSRYGFGADCAERGAAEHERRERGGSSVRGIVDPLRQFEAPSVSAADRKFSTDRRGRIYREIGLVSVFGLWSLTSNVYAVGDRDAAARLLPYHGEVFDPRGGPQRGPERLAVSNQPFEPDPVSTGEGTKPSASPAR